MTKLCTKCGIEKDVSEFHKNKHSKDGLNVWCKQCRKRGNKIIDDLNSNMKICRMCNVLKDKSEFTKDKTRKDGYDCYCKDCKGKIKSEYYINNIEQYQEYARNNYAKHNKYIREKSKNYYNNNKCRAIEARKKWRKKNIEKSRKISTKYKYKDPLRYLLTNCLSRARKNNIPFNDRQDLYNHLKPIFDHGVCECCGCELEHGIGKGTRHAQSNSYSIDRIIPKLGYTVGNVAILCYRCNVIKRDSTPQELHMIADWYQQKINLINTENNSERIDINVSA